MKVWRAEVAVEARMVVPSGDLGGVSGGMVR